MKRRWARNRQEMLRKVIEKARQVNFESRATQETLIPGSIITAAFDVCLAHAHFDPANHLSRLVYFYEHGKLEFKYAVRTDGFPVTYHVTA